MLNELCSLFCEQVGGDGSCVAIMIHELHDPSLVLNTSRVPSNSRTDSLFIGPGLGCTSPAKARRENRCQVELAVLSGFAEK